MTSEKINFDEKLEDQFEISRRFVDQYVVHCSRQSQLLKQSQHFTKNTQPRDMCWQQIKISYVPPITKKPLSIQIFDNNSSNLFSKLCTVLIHLNTEVVRLEKEAELQFYPPLTLYGYNFGIKEALQEGDLQIHFSKLLPTLQDLSQFIDYLEKIAISLLEQIASISNDHWSEGGNLVVTDLVSQQLQSSYVSLGKALGILIKIQQVMFTNPYLYTSFTSYRRMLTTQVQEKKAQLDIEDNYKGMARQLSKGRQNLFKTNEPKDYVPPSLGVLPFDNIQEISEKSQYKQKQSKDYNPDLSLQKIGEQQDIPKISHVYGQLDDAYLQMQQMQELEKSIQNMETLFLQQGTFQRFLDRLKVSMVNKNAYSRRFVDSLADTVKKLYSKYVNDIQNEEQGPYAYSELFASCMLFIVYLQLCRPQLVDKKLVRQFLELNKQQQISTIHIFGHVVIDIAQLFQYYFTPSLQYLLPKDHIQTSTFHRRQKLESVLNNYDEKLQRISLQVVLWQPKIQGFLGSKRKFQEDLQFSIVALLQGLDLITSLNDFVMKPFKLFLSLNHPITRLQWSKLMKPIALLKSMQKYIQQEMPSIVEGMPNLLTFLKDKISQMAGQMLSKLNQGSSQECMRHFTQPQIGIWSILSVTHWNVNSLNYQAFAVLTLEMLQQTLEIGFCENQLQALHLVVGFLDHIHMQDQFQELRSLIATYQGLGYFSTIISSKFDMSFLYHYIEHLRKIIQQLMSEPRLCYSFPALLDSFFDIEKYFQYCDYHDTHDIQKVYEEQVLKTLQDYFIPQVVAQTSTCLSRLLNFTEKFGDKGFNQQQYSDQNYSLNEEGSTKSSLNMLSVRTLKNFILDVSDENIDCIKADIDIGLLSEVQDIKKIVSMRKMVVGDLVFDTQEQVLFHIVLLILQETIKKPYQRMECENLLSIAEMHLDMNVGKLHDVLLLATSQQESNADSILQAIITDFDDFANNYYYAMDTHSFFQQPRINFAQNKNQIQVINTNVLAQSLKECGLGIIKECAKVVYEFLEEQLTVLSELLYEQEVYKRLKREDDLINIATDNLRLSKANNQQYVNMREAQNRLQNQQIKQGYNNDIIDSQNQNMELGYPFAWAASLADDLKQVQKDHEEDIIEGITILDDVRDVITQIGNALGFLRMLEFAIQKAQNQNLSFLYGSNFYQDQNSIQNQQEQASFFERNQNKQMSSNLRLKVQGLQQQSVMAAGTLSYVLSVYGQSTYIPIKGYLNQIRQDFQASLHGVPNDHLKTFFIAVPAISLNFVETMLMNKERLRLNQRGPDASQQIFSESGFPLGLSFILQLLGQSEKFEQLRWFQSLEHYAQEELHQILNQEGMQHEDELITRSIQGIQNFLNSKYSAPKLIMFGGESLQDQPSTSKLMQGNLLNKQYANSTGREGMRKSWVQGFGGLFGVSNTIGNLFQQNIADNVQLQINKINNLKQEFQLLENQLEIIGGGHWFG